jgi:hypothetical protein
MSEEASPAQTQSPRREWLFDPFAATLDKDDQHNDRKNSSYNPNDCYIVHVNSPFSMSEVPVKTFHYGDRRGTQRYQKKRGEDKQHEREDKFHCCLRRLFLDCLATLSS